MDLLLYEPDKSVINNVFIPLAVKFIINMIIECSK